MLSWVMSNDSNSNSIIMMPPNQNLMYQNITHHDSNSKFTLKVFIQTS